MLLKLYALVATMGWCFALPWYNCSLLMRVGADAAPQSAPFLSGHASHQRLTMRQTAIHSLPQPLTRQPRLLRPPLHAGRPAVCGGQPRRPDAPRGAAAGPPAAQVPARAAGDGAGRIQAAGKRRSCCWVLQLQLGHVVLWGGRRRRWMPLSMACCCPVPRRSPLNAGLRHTPVRYKPTTGSTPTGPPSV